MRFPRNMFEHCADSHRRTVAVFFYTKKIKQLFCAKCIWSNCCKKTTVLKRNTENIH